MVPSTSCFSGRRIAVLGAGETGRASAPVLRGLGADVVLWDEQDNPGLRARALGLRELGVELRLGASPEAGLDGADLVVTSPGIPATAPTLRMAALKGLPILSEIEVAFLISKARIAAVTGTNGKTTTAALLGEMLAEGGMKSWVAGNYAAEGMRMPLITAASRAGSDDTIVAEVSSYQLEWVERFRPAVGILTNIDKDHLTRHGSFAEYAACKERLFRAQGPDDVAVLNAMNGPARKMARRIHSRAMWFDRANCSCPLTACVRDGQVMVRFDDVDYRLGPADRVLLPGSHNLENVLAAAAAAIALGADASGVERAMTTFRGVPDRMEFVAVRRGVKYINNSMCTNVDAARRSIEAIAGPQVIIAGGDGKGADFAPLGPVIAQHVRHLVLMGADADRIEAAARGARFSAIHRVQSLEEAVALASTLAEPGSTVMLAPACASQDMFRNFEERGQVFRQAVRSLPE